MTRSSPRTPRRSSRNALQHENYRSAYPGSLLPRDSLMDISPTLVGDSSPPVAREATPSSAGVASSQTTVSFDETCMGSTCDLSTMSTVSTRRKPICRTCGTPRKGHKGGRCPIQATDNDNKSLYASSPENELRTPLPATLSSASTCGGRKPPHCRKCGWPTKGHKRPGGVTQCPTGPSMPPDWEHSANLTPTSPRLKPPNKAPSKQNFCAQEMDAGVSAQDSTPKRSSDVGKFSASPEHERRFNTATSRVILTSVSPTLAAAAHRRRQRDISPLSSLALSEHRSSLSQIRPLAPPSPRQDQEDERTTSQRNIDSTPAPLSSASGHKGSPSAVHTHGADSSDSLCKIFGEPELAVYPARNRHEVTRIRNKARELRYFSGVININFQEYSGTKNGGEAEDMAKINERDLKDERHSYTKWVILSKRESIVRKCVDLYEGQLAE